MIRFMAGDASQMSLGPSFSEGFLEDHAGRIISDPKIAIAELVANSWDAGARSVELSWPAGLYEQFVISDDGEGMTKNEFRKIWLEFSYNRVQKQGTIVKFPREPASIKRTAYGRNGKGRHSLFCFADEYKVETWKDGSFSLFRIIRNHKGESAHSSPFSVELIREGSKEGNGTKIYCKLIKNYISEEEVMDIIGGKFSTDPSFSISLNKHKIALSDLKGTDKKIIEIPGEGNIEIIRIDSTVSGRTSRQHGIAWWVNHRLVGEHSWKWLDEQFLDRRTSEAKRYSFIVNADILINEVKPDWTGFEDTDKVKRITDIVNSHIQEYIQDLLRTNRISRKKAVLSEHRADLRQLGNISREHIGEFIDQTLTKCPGIGLDNLSKVVGILANIEASRTGYNLLNQLSQLSSDDFDRMSEILNDWSVLEAKIVLDELRRRLELIKQLEALIDNASTDELHELHPLFEQGLWMFGPEYEGIRFLSNRQLATILREFFGKRAIETPRRRPDIVALPNTSVEIYGSYEYDSRGEVCGYNKILVIELKKGGYTITDEEVHQAEAYAKAIKKSVSTSPNVKIICYVLGAKVDCEPSRKGETIEVIPRPYSIVLGAASARTFNLIQKIKEAKEIEELSDKEVKEILSQREISDSNNSLGKSAS